MKAVAEMERVEYDKIQEYEAVVSIAETLRYCSDREHPMRMIEISIRCAIFINNWIEPKRMQRAMKILLNVSRKPSWVEMFGGQVVKAEHGYYWEKSDSSVRVEKLLRRKIDNPVCGGLLDKLGLNADMKNEEKWRRSGELQKRLESAVYYKISSPYTESVLEWEEKLEQRS